MRTSTYQTLKNQQQNYVKQNTGQITNLKETNKIEAMQGTLMYSKRAGICSG